MGRLSRRVLSARYLTGRTKTPPFLGNSSSFNRLSYMMTLQADAYAVAAIPWTAGRIPRSRQQPNISLQSALAHTRLAARYCANTCLELSDAVSTHCITSHRDGKYFNEFQNNSLDGLHAVLDKGKPPSLEQLHERILKTMYMTIFTQPTLTGRITVRCSDQGLTSMTLLLRPCLVEELHDSDNTKGEGFKLCDMNDIQGVLSTFA